MVSNAKGDLVGIVLAIGHHSYRFNIALVTPISAIDQDVRDMTGGFLSLD